MAQILAVVNKMLLHTMFDRKLNMVCNLRMNQIEQDAKLIEKLGGPARVAERLNLDKRAGGVQRVSNWIRRGIPSDVKLAHPDLFLPQFTARSTESAANA